VPDEQQGLRVPAIGLMCHDFVRIETKDDRSSHFASQLASLPGPQGVDNSCVKCDVMMNYMVSP